MGPFCSEEDRLRTESPPTSHSESNVIVPYSHTKSFYTDIFLDFVHEGLQASASNSAVVIGLHLMTDIELDLLDESDCTCV